MKKLDQRGTAAWEFCVVAVALFTLMYVIFELGRYAITMQSLRALANAGARSIMITCYTDAAINKTTPSCSGDPLSDSDKKNAAPFLYAGGLTPTLSAVTSANAITVTASQPAFRMAMFGVTASLWGTTLDAPSASTKIPF